MKHALSVVIVSWQRSEHGYSSLRYETCSVSCHRLMTTVRAWLFIPKVWNMLRQLFSPEHGYSSLRYETCSVSCHRLVTTVRAWLFIPKVWNMLRQLSSWYDNGQSMVIYHLCMKHAPTVVIVSWQWTEKVRSMLRQLSSFRDIQVRNMRRPLWPSHDHVRSMVIPLFHKEPARLITMVR